MLDLYGTESPTLATSARRGGSLSATRASTRTRAIAHCLRIGSAGCDRPPSPAQTPEWCGECEGAVGGAGGGGRDRVSGREKEEAWEKEEGGG